MKVAPFVKHGLLGRAPTTPVSLILLVTSRCNARCAHCFFADELNQRPDLLTVEDCERLSQELSDLCQLYIGGGEPFLRKDLTEICRVFDRRNRVANVTIPTNGYLVDRTVRVVEEILATCSCDLMVSLSIDGTRELHDTIRRVPGGFVKLCRTYEGLHSLHARYPAFRIQVTTTIMRNNIHNLPLLVEWVKHNMPDLSAHNFELVRGRPNEHCEQLPAVEDLRAFERIHRDMLAEGNGYIPGSRIKSWLARRMKANLFAECLQVLDEQRQVFDCVGGTGMGVVDDKGDVFLCEMLPRVGNILAGGFRAAWNSPEAESIRRAIQAKECYCTHSCFQVNSNLMNPRSYWKMLR